MPVFKNTGEDLLLSRIESRLTSPNLSPFTAGFFGRVAIACRFPHLSSAHSNPTTPLPGPPASGCTSPPPSRALLFQPPLPLSSQHFISTCHHPPIPTPLLTRLSGWRLQPCSVFFHPDLPQHLAHIVQIVGFFPSSSSSSLFPEQ